MKSKTKRVNTILNEWIHERLKAIAKEKQISVSCVARQILSDYINKIDKKREEIS